MRSSNDTFDKNKKSWCWHWGLTIQTGTGDKANINNPKVNRGCAPLTANRTSADCVQISLGPSMPYIPLGVYHTGGFNAMKWINSLQDHMIAKINILFPISHCIDETDIHTCNCHSDRNDCFNTENNVKNRVKCVRSKYCYSGINRCFQLL